MRTTSSLCTCPASTTPMCMCCDTDMALACRRRGEAAGLPWVWRGQRILEQGHQRLRGLRRRRSNVQVGTSCASGTPLPLCLAEQGEIYHGPCQTLWTVLQGCLDRAQEWRLVLELHHALLSVNSTLQSGWPVSTPPLQAGALVTGERSIAAAACQQSSDEGVPRTPSSDANYPVTSSTEYP